MAVSRGQSGWLCLAETIFMYVEDRKNESAARSRKFPVRFRRPSSITGNKYATLLETAIGSYIIQPVEYDTLCFGNDIHHLSVIQPAGQVVRVQKHILSGLLVCSLIYLWPCGLMIDERWRCVRKNGGMRGFPQRLLEYGSANFFFARSGCRRSSLMSR